MRSITLIFLFLLHSLMSLAQPLSPKETDFLHQVIPAQCLHNRVVYSSGVDPNEIHGMLRDLKERFKMDTIHKNSWDTSFTLFLAPKKKKQILEFVADMKKPFSTKGLLDSAIVVPSAEITQLFNKYMEDGWSKFYEKYYPSWPNTNISTGYYEFSKPLFLSDSLCLFYWSQVCGQTCGEGHLTFYKLVKGQWQRWFDIYNWIS